MFDKNKVIAKLSVGIGYTIKEAGEALLFAKTKKNKNLFLNIEIYNGKNKLEIQENDYNETINSYNELEKFLIETKNQDKLKCLESFLYDPKTNLLNRIGYNLQINKLKKENKYKNRAILFFDVDDMHSLNEKLGYNKTDNCLKLIGQTLNHCIRKNRELEDQDFLNVTVNDPISHRKNDNVGDEFIIDLHCPNNDLSIAKKVAIRYLSEIYKEQENIK